MSFCSVILFVNQVCIAEPGSWNVTNEAAPLATVSPVLIPEMINLDEIAKQLKVTEFKGRKFTRKIKVAVLDNGFSGYEAEVGKSLPKNTRFHNGKASDADRNETTSFHGLFMAKILAEVIAKSGAKADYELHLFNAFGYTKFADAVETVVRENFDIVLYAQVWEYGGSGDGRGFINAVVTKAVEAGVIWINAAGNFGHLTRTAAVAGKVDGTAEWVVFKNNSDTVKLNCKASAKEQCDLRLVLAWNDFKDDPDTGSDKDLDLFLSDGKGVPVASSERNQKLEKDLADKMASRIPRELIETKVDPGSYNIKVKIKSKNFSASQDRLRLTVSGSHMSLDKPSVGETLLPPADHPGVLVIGASDDIQTNTSKSLNKPDILLRSLVKLKDGSNPFSTSNAAAMAAGVAVLHLGTGGEKNRDAVLAAMKPLSQKTEVPGFEEPAPQVSRNQGNVEANCLRSMSAGNLFPAARKLLSRRGTAFVRSHGRYVIVVRGEFSRYFDVRNLDDDQRVFISPDGLHFYGPEDFTRGIDRRSVEVVIARTPICGGESDGELSWMK